MRHIALIIAVALLVGCGPTRPDPPVVPKIVHVTVEKIVPVPARLTKRVEVYKIKAQTWGEAVEAANKRKAAADQCNIQLGEIEALGLKP